MRTVHFDPDKLTDQKEKEWWRLWLEAASDARTAVLESWEKWLATDPAQRGIFKPPLKQDIWKDLKRWLLPNVFNDRCAYCESPLVFDRYKGDAEHYRPKGRVTWKNDATKPKVMARCKLPDGSEIDHPGYFWLAYDWRNLVPACSACNSGAGKVDQFPVRDAHVLQLDDVAIAAEPEAIEVPKSSKKYFTGPHTLDAKEQPLLLNPLNPTADRDPTRHLRYGLGGVVVAVDNSEIGKKSIEVYRLKRGALEKRRQLAQEAAHREYYLIRARLPGPGQDAEMDEMLNKYRVGKEDFSSAVLDHLRTEQKRKFSI